MKCPKYPSKVVLGIHTFAEIDGFRSCILLHVTIRTRIVLSPYINELIYFVIIVSQYQVWREREILHMEESQYPSSFSRLLESVSS